MTMQEAKLLRFLKSVQIKEMNLVRLDYENKTAETMNVVGAKKKTKSLNRYFCALTPMLDSLCEQGYISIPNPKNHNLIQVKHSAWHLTQLSVKKVAIFVLCNILVPIIVASLTAYITIRLNLPQ